MFSDFAQFPRKKLTLKYSRRELFSMVWKSLTVIQKKCEGGVAFTLADLGEWTDSDLAYVTPMVAAGCKITVEENFVMGQPADAPTPIRLFSQESPSVLVFNLFNGMTLLKDVSAALETSMNWEADYSFLYVRGLFLFLVELGICQPRF